MFEWIFSAEMWIALATLIGLEIVLGLTILFLLRFWLVGFQKNKDRKLESLV